MKIALFHNLLSGGAKRSLHELVRRIGARHQIDVITLSTADHDFADLRPYVAGYEILPFRPTPLFGSPFGRLNPALRLLDLMRLDAAGRELARRVERGSYDLLLAEPCRFENSPSILYHARGLPSVFYCQEPLRLIYEQMPFRPYDDRGSTLRRSLDRVDPLPRAYRALLRRRDRRNLRSAGRVLVNSDFVRGALRRIYGVEASVSRLGVDSDLFHPLASRRDGAVLSVGSLTPLKGFDFLIRALGRLPADGRPLLKIVCNFQNPPERAYLELLAQEHGVRLEIRVGVSDADLVEAYNEAALTVYAPVGEPFGLVPLESMACATPLVAVREGGIPETVVHEQVGLLADRHEGQFAEAVRQLLADPARVERYGRNARAHVMREWTWDRAAAALEEHLASVASSN
jgi:glycosyltransferase involved in cell wall biosynthesis